MIPDSIVSELKREVEGSRFFGVPVQELSRDELLAALGAAFRQERDNAKLLSMDAEFYRRLATR